MERRHLVLRRLEDVPAEVDRLLLGHRAVGGWTLGQVARHLATAIRLTARGASAGRGPDFDPARFLARQIFFAVGRIPSGLPVPAAILDPPADADAPAEAARLRLAIEAFGSMAGPFPIHPQLGALTRRQWTRFHQIHCAHHLSYIIPVDPAG